MTTRLSAEMDRNRQLFPLILRVGPAIILDLDFLDVPRIGDDQPVSRLPARDRLLERERRVTRAGFHCERAQKSALLTAPCTVIFPKFKMPVPNCSGSGRLPPVGVLAMTISAVTLAATGFAAVPTSRYPTAVMDGMPWSPITMRFVTRRRVFTVGLNRSVP